MPALLADSELVLTCLVLLPWAGARCLHMPWEPCGVFLPDVSDVCTTLGSGCLSLHCSTLVSSFNMPGAAPCSCQVALTIPPPMSACTLCQPCITFNQHSSACTHLSALHVHGLLQRGSD